MYVCPPIRKEFLSTFRKVFVAPFLRRRARVSKSPYAVVSKALGKLSDNRAFSQNCWSLASSGTEFGCNAPASGRFDKLTNPLDARD